MSTEVYQIDLDEEFLSHLAIPESFKYLWNEEPADELIEDESILEIWHWQLAHNREHGHPATPSVLADEFDLDIDDPLTAVGDLLQRLRERYLQNHVREHMEEVSDAYKGDPAKVIEVLPKVARDIQLIVGERGEEYGSGDFERAIAKYDEAVLKGPGPSLGFGELDQHFYGLKGLTFLIAAPKTYKSWLAVKMCVANIISGRTIELNSLELPADETDMRIRCLAAGIPYWRYLRGSLTHEHRETLREVSEYLDDCGLYRVVKPQPGRRSFEEMIDRAGERGADGVIIDQLQYVETREGKHLGGCKPQEYWQPLNKARDLSDDLPVMTVHQFNRSVMNADQMPEMQQAKGASSIEETATLALGVWANKDMRRSNVIELGTLASRNYQFAAWEIGVELSRGCDFEMIGPAVHDED